MSVAPAHGLELDDVRFRYPGGAAMVFDGRIEPDSLTAVMGPSGSGKSTLFALLAGFEEPQSGALRMQGHDVTALPPAARPVSMVFQENNLFAHLDVETNVALGIDPRRRPTAADRDKVSRALERVGLGGFARRRPASLSGGERQRVALARALVRRRPVLLLDEPFAALGPGLRDDMLQLVGELQREMRSTTLMITHQPSDATAVADTILFLDAGRIVSTMPAARALDRRDIAGWQDYLGRSGSIRPG